MVTAAKRVGAAGDGDGLSRAEPQPRRFDGDAILRCVYCNNSNNNDNNDNNDNDDNDDNNDNENNEEEEEEEEEEEVHNPAPLPILRPWTWR
jgi:hypothetical protein